MKKFSILLFAVLAMISCGNTYEGRKAVLLDENDSINYALGLVNGAQIKMYYMTSDTSAAVVEEFMVALRNAYEGKVTEKSQAQAIAEQFGSSIKQFETEGLAEQPRWALNEKMLFQGLVNGILSDTTVMQNDEAREFFQTHYMAANADTTELPKLKTVKAKCGKKAKTVALKTLNDSLNFSFGMMQGVMISGELTVKDTTGTAFSDFVDQLNKTMKSKVKNPRLVMLAENIGQTIAKQEPEGLLGIEQIPTEFDLIEQGFVNGLVGYEEQMSAQEAAAYVENAINKIRYGENLQEGEAFLAENAKRPEVTVTESGLQYEVLKAGKGAVPQASDNVKVHYHGTLIDGTVFDSSVERGEPAVFGVTQVIKGWVEALQLMPVGSKWRLYIPQQLAYGSNSAGRIPPYSALIFDVELLEIVK